MFNTFLELKQNDGKMVLINLRAIETVQPYNSHGEKLTRIDTASNSYFIKASYSEIKDLISKAGF